MKKENATIRALDRRAREQKLEGRAFILLWIAFLLTFLLLTGFFVYGQVHAARETGVYTSSILESGATTAPTLDEALLHAETEGSDRGEVLGGSVRGLRDVGAPVQKAAAKRDDSVSRGNTYILVTVGGHGYAIPLEMEIREGGDGKVLLNIENAYYYVNLQRSVKKAYVAAMRTTGTSLGRKDVVISFGDPFESREMTIEGESAGAAIAVALVAAIEGKEIRPEVLVTGTIEEEGTIENVGGIHRKAEAAKKAGATTLLVAAGDFTLIEGLKVVEVHDLEEAIEEMLQ
jgi:hypothetical protein